VSYNGVGAEFDGGVPGSSSTAASRTGPAGSGLDYSLIGTGGRVISAGRRRRRGRWAARLGAGWLILIVLVAVFADLLPLPPYEDSIAGPAIRPNLRSFDLFLGTDSLGRSNLARIAYGARVSLLVGLGAVGFGSAIGAALGMSMAYYRGRVEAIGGVVVDSMLAFPPLILLLALSVILTPGLFNLTVALSFLFVPAAARVCRANTLALAEREFVRAAQSMGASSFRVVTREILPNVAVQLLPFVFVLFAVAIVAEGSLSFLGLGIPPPFPSWGGMIASGRSRIGSDPYLVFVPGFFLFVTVYALNTVGDVFHSQFDAREVRL
jgi:peptide/nickel transport system permease protein